MGESSRTEKVEGLGRGNCSGTLVNCLEFFGLKVVAFCWGLL